MSRQPSAEQMSRWWTKTGNKYGKDRLVGRLGGAGHTKELRPYPIAAEEASGASLKKCQL